MGTMHYEHRYKWTRLNRSFNLFEQMNDMRDNEFILAGLQAMDNTQDNVICITNKFIFDSTSDNIIDFSNEALDLCCPPGFQYMYTGAYFNTRIEHPTDWLCKTKPNVK